LWRIHLVLTCQCQCETEEGGGGDTSVLVSNETVGCQRWKGVERDGWGGDGAWFRA
jgi:hypothetical protein